MVLRVLLVMGWIIALGLLHGRGHDVLAVVLNLAFGGVLAWRDSSGASR